MLCGQYEGRLLSLISSIMQPHCAVEVGSFVGYSTICIARGLSPDGILHAFEINEELEDVIHRHLREAAVDEKVKLHIGDAGELIERQFPLGDRTIDLAFIDAGKRDMLSHYEMIVPRMRKNGVVIVDNVLWDGKVLDTEQNHDADTRMIAGFNDRVQNDNRVENMILDVRDGVLICKVL